MCPACVSTLILVAAGAGSAGGLTGFLVRRLRDRGRPARDVDDDRSPSKEEPR